MDKSPADKPVTYKDAGVDIDAGNRFVSRIKPLVSATHRSGVVSGIGGFGGLFDPAAAGFSDPVLVSGTDGVGTKLMVAQMLGRHTTIGIDLVAMCVNDVVVQGAEPLFFLDYFASGHLDLDTAADVVAGIAEGCQQAGCALIGGETAEMPDMYGDGDYDLAGFCVGAVERDQLIDGSAVRAGQALIGLASSGPHSNGYSLIRRIIERSNASLDLPLAGGTLADAVIEPTRIYVRPLLELLKQAPVAGLAHITGGGMMENIIRVAPDDVGITFDPKAWDWPAIFGWLADHGPVTESEMLTTFNCGIGMVAIVDQPVVDDALAVLTAAGVDARVIGETRHIGDNEPRVLLT